MPERMRWRSAAIPTLTQAEKHWRSHAQGILTHDAKKSFKRGESWTKTRQWHPVVVSQDRNYAIAFYRDSETGEIDMAQVYANSMR